MVLQVEMVVENGWWLKGFIGAVCVNSSSCALMCTFPYAINYTLIKHAPQRNDPSTAWVNLNMFINRIWPVGFLILPHGLLTWEDPPEILLSENLHSIMKRVMPCTLKKKKKALPLSHRYMDMCVKVIRIYTKPKRGERLGKVLEMGWWPKETLPYCIVFNCQFSF